MIPGRRRAGAAPGRRRVAQAPGRRRTRLLYHADL